MAGLALIVASGAWLVVAPFALRFQAPGAHWTAATRIDVLIGLILVTAGLTGFFTALAGRVREMYADLATRD
jgi:hypothetical protein